MIPPPCARMAGQVHTVAPMKNKAMLSGFILPEHLHMPILIVSTALALAISMFLLMQGWLTIFQNIFYIPIILACVFYRKRGFVFSVLLAWIYFAMIVSVTEDRVVLEGALIRVFIFILVAAVTTLLSLIWSWREETLQRDEQFFRAIYETSSDLIHVLDTSGVITSTNKGNLAITGYSEEEFIGKSIKDYFTPASQEIFDNNFPILMEKGHNRVEVEFLCKDGSILDIDCSGSVVRDSSGAIRYFVVFQRDITKRKQVEEALLESETKFREIFNSANDAIEMIDYGDNRYPGKFIEVNDNACRMVQYTREELLTRSPFDISTDTYNRPLGEIMQEIATRGQSTFETEYRRKDGTIVPVEINSHLILLHGKKVILSVTRDITERKKNETALRENERLLSDIIEFLPDATFVIDKDRRVVSWNRAIEKMTGIPKKDIVGKGDYVYGLPFFGRNIPILIDSLFSPGAEINPRYTNVRHEAETINAEVLVSSLRGGEGAFVWATASPLYDKTGAIIGAIESIRDITENKKAETALKESFETFKTVMDSLDALVYAADMKTYELLFINEYGRQLFGDITGNLCWKSLQDGQSGPCPFCTNRDLVDSAGHPSGILTWEFKNTITGRWFECRDSAIQWVDGRTVRLEIATDITERKKAQDALRQANRQLNLLGSITRHDINNKISVILGYLRIAAMKSTDPVMEEIFGKIGSATSAIQSQIAFTKVYQDLGTHEPQWQDVDKILPRPSLPATITLHSFVQGILVFAAPMLEKVFFNLLDNSIRHGHHVTEIRVSSGYSGESLKIVWEDNGAGIPAYEKEKIFERGFGKNTGLGLFLVREILLLTEITIKETGEEGKGARFEITVPKGSWRIANGK